MPVLPNESSSPKQPTRFVEHPARRRAWRYAQRNLAWGAAFLFAALSVLGVALYMGGPGAMVPPVLCMLSFTALWVLARLKIFSQRNGVFFSLAIVALLGSLAALVQQGWGRLGHRSEPRVATSAPSESVISSGSSPEIPSLIEALRLDEPDPSLPRARANRDLLTSIGGKSYRIRRGDLFLVADEKGGELVLGAGEFLARVPANAMEMLAPSTTAASAKGGDDGKGALDKQAQLARNAHEAAARAEAARRYPALSRAGSPENKVFVETYNDLQRRHSDMLDDPDWPLELAQTLAQRLGWKQTGVIEDDTPPTIESPIAPGTKVLAPEANANTAPPPASSADSDIPPPPRVPPGMQPSRR